MISMKIQNDRKNFAEEARRELRDRIIPYWQKLRDEKYGGYLGYVGFNLKSDPEYEKGGILNSRILYFFSEAYLLLKDEALLADARNAYTFLKDRFWDRERGGIYWSLDYQGNPRDTTKHTYCQAFAIYGLCSFYEASRDPEALQLACTLFDTIESGMRDEMGYLEAFDVAFHPASNEKLSENGVHAARTMNTLLHVIEAYTALYRCVREPSLPKVTVQVEQVGERLREALEIVLDRVYNPKRTRLEVFFDAEYHSLIDLYSYGHDIEAAWLLDLAADTLGIPSVSERVHQMTRAMEASVYREAFDGQSIPAECENGKVLTKRVWWVQAEAVNGYLHAYLKAPKEDKYYTAARNIFAYIQEKMVDPRQNSEWYAEVQPDGTPHILPMTDPWKCPYHNGRMCFEIIRSLENADT